MSFLSWQWVGNKLFTFQKAMVLLLNVVPMRARSPPLPMCDFAFLFVCFLFVSSLSSYASSRGPIQEFRKGRTADRKRSWFGVGGDWRVQCNRCVAPIQSIPLLGMKSNESWAWRSLTGRHLSTTLGLRRWIRVVGEGGAKPFWLALRLCLLGYPVWIE